MVKFSDIFDGRYERFITDYRHWLPQGFTVPTAEEAWKYVSVAADALPELGEYVMGAEVIEFERCSDIIGHSELVAQRWMDEVRPALRAAAKDSKVELDRFARRAAAFYWLVISAQEQQAQEDE